MARGRWIDDGPVCARSGGKTRRIARVYNWTDDDLKTHERIWIPKAGPTAVDEAVHCRHIAMAEQIGTLS